MRIWVDADACPKAVKEILFRAARKTGIPLVLVANKPLRIPKSPHIGFVLVRDGFDIADEHIVQQARAGDLVVTEDIPLAAGAVEKGAVALTPRGKRLTRDNIRETLTMRNMMDELRSTGIDTGGPPAFKNRDREAFANQLHRYLMEQEDG